mgnify:CR=1 FL=1
MINIERLNIFLHVADTLSFSMAAQSLNLSQPTVSKHISKLEQELNIKLFYRHPNNIQLTESGKTLQSWARKQVYDNINLQKMMESIDQEISGHLRIACSTTAGKYILPQLAARFRKNNPGVKISILPCSQGDISLKLKGEEADLGVASVEIGRGLLECQYFFTDHIIMIVPITHPWAKRSSVEPEELLSEPILLREPTSGTRHVLQAELAQHDISLEDLNVLLEVGNAEAIVFAIAAGLGISFVSKMASAYARVWGCVVDVPVTGLELRRKICVGRKIMGTPNRAMEAFWSFIHAPDNADLMKLPEL